MREIRQIIIHCSATPEARVVTAEEIDDWHRGRGWSGIGYHYVIGLDGEVWEGRDIETPGAHARGYNSHSIGICYVGGMSEDMSAPKDTRTPEQNAALVKLVFTLKSKYGLGNDAIFGHNEVSQKACPSFDVRKWIKELKWD